MKDREIIAALLHGIGRRLWVRRALQEVLAAACVLLFFLIALRMAWAMHPQGIPAAGIFPGLVVAAAVLAFLGHVAWRVSRKVSPGQAAAQADARARLHDELKSAWWFVSHEETSPFIEAQVARAASTASRLDARAIVPGRAPGALYAAIALAAAFGAVTWLAPQLTPFWDANAAPSPTTAGERDLRSLLRDAPKDARIDKLAEAIDTLESDSATPEQKRKAMEAMRELSEQTGMEVMAARDGLARLADTLAADPQFKQVAEAMKAGKVAEASALLEDLKAEMAQQGKEEEQFPEAAPSTQAQGAAGEGLDRSGQNLAGSTPQASVDAVEQARRKLDQLAQDMKVQNEIEKVRNNAKERMSTTGQRSAGRANAFGQANQQQAGNPTPAPENGNTDMAGGAMFRQGQARREEDADGAQEGVRTGEAAGESDAMPVMGRKTERLEAQLKLEAVRRRDEDKAEGEKDDEEWMYRPSQQQASALEYEQVRARGGFDRESAGDHDRIPVRQQQVVKNYFLNLHESEKK
jgi:uncharacterized protein (UPF0147 family)